MIKLPVSRIAKLSFGAVTALYMSTATTGMAQSGAVTLPPEDPAKLAQFLEDHGASERINFAGKLRMLSQRIPAAACAVHADIATDQSVPVLKAAHEEFQTILNALEFGDEALGIIGAEERRKTLVVLEELHAAFDPLNDALVDIETTGGTDEEILALAEANGHTLNVAKLLVSEITGEYANPVALLQSDALAIDIAGRQRMLTQKMSKEVCLIMSGIHADASLEVLGGTMNMFETSLNALQHGMPAAGIMPAKDDAIIAGLAKVAADWAEIRGHVETVANGGTIDAATQAAVFTGLNITMADMNATVGLYTAGSKQGL